MLSKYASPLDDHDELDTGARAVVPGAYMGMMLRQMVSPAGMLPMTACAVDGIGTRIVVQDVEARPNVNGKSRYDEETGSFPLSVAYVAAVV